MDRNSIVLFISVGIIAFASLNNTANITIFHKSKESTLTQVAELVKAKEMHALSHQSKEAFNHEAFNALLVAHVSETGIVNYKGFVENKKLLEDYIALLGESLPTETWTIEDKLAYWMNAYNAMTIDLIVKNYPIKSIKDLDKPWSQRLWKLGDTWYNLNEIEHQILRKMNEPRIHFGINCASFSCPPLLNEAFVASKVDAQLNTLAIRFINDSQRNTISKTTVEISEIFSWFAKDFKKNGALFEFLNNYSKVQIDPKAKKKFKKYDWTLNE
ncbi:MAG: DUF547 domain-containing protein [Flavobacteriales bacterium]